MLNDYFSKSPEEQAKIRDEVIIPDHVTTEDFINEIWDNHFEPMLEKAVEAEYEADSEYAFHKDEIDNIRGCVLDDEVLSNPYKHPALTKAIKFFKEKGKLDDLKQLLIDNCKWDNPGIGCDSNPDEEDIIELCRFNHGEREIQLDELHIDKDIMQIIEKFPQYQRWLNKTFKCSWSQKNKQNVEFPVYLYNNMSYDCIRLYIDPVDLSIALQEYYVNEGIKFTLEVQE